MTPPIPAKSDDSYGLPVPARYWAMAVVVLGISMSVLDASIVNLALPTITREMHASAAHSVWVVNAYQIAIVAFLLPCAALGDRIGYRRVYLAGMSLFTLASLGCAFATSLPTLGVTRAVQGLGAAGVMSVNTALVRLIFPRQLLGRGVAVNSMAVGASSVAGPSIAAGILSVASWPWLFAVNLPLGGIVLLLGYRFLPRNPRREMAAAAPAGALALSDIVLNALMFSFIFMGADALGARGALPGQASSYIGATLLLAGLLIAVVFLRRQARQAQPIFPVDLLRIPVFALSMCTSITAFAAQTLTFIALPFLLLDAYGHSPLQAGALITAWPLALVATAPLAGFLIGRIPDGLLGGIGLGILAIGLALLTWLAGAGGQPTDAAIVWRFALCGLGFGLFQSPNNHTILTSAPLHRSGGASGMLGTARLTGQTIGAILVAAIFSFADPHNGQGPTLAMGVAAAFSAIAAVFSSLRIGRGTSDAASHRTEA